VWLMQSTVTNWFDLNDFLHHCKAFFSFSVIFCQNSSTALVGTSRAITRAANGIQMCFLFLSSTDNNVQIIDEEMQSQEQMKMRRLTLKSQADDLEAEMNDIRKRLTTQQKESNGIQKALTALEIKLEQKRADRHSLLKSCKVSAFGSMI